jgi:hypothetical protein
MVQLGLQKAMVKNIHIFANIFTGPAPPSGACPSFLFVGELETMISGWFANPKKSKLAGKSTLYHLVLTFTVCELERSTMLLRTVVTIYFYRPS